MTEEGVVPNRALTHRKGGVGRDPLRIVVADDNPVVRAGLVALLHGREDIEVVAEAADGHEAYEAALRHRPDVILLDVRMPGVDGISALPHLVGLAPVMMLTYSRESEIVREALRLGAGGYLVHGEFTADELGAAVRGMGQGRAVFTATAADALLAHVREQPDRAVANSAEPLSQLQPFVAQSSTARRAVSMRNRADFRLSSREAEVMELIAAGMSNQQIAATCFISEKTVKNHINRIFAKLNSTTRGEAIAHWLGVRHA
ncbi:DNA-binding response regulator [Streptomyces sp. CB01201]|uniref:response regulator n=1 Tax=Streptomyces sp. CB01201 TaxID=2020324 RepID=UPI000C2809EB|nr:response regulator transcription factor [Streptomyces sp. CB01201]PJN03062.1 DNA-binding response regulator [Streptomyces sp. CB01201]